MVKTPKTYYSQSHQEPVTIELEPGAISNVEDNESVKTIIAESMVATVDKETIAAATMEARDDQAKAEVRHPYDYNSEDSQSANELRAEEKVSATSRASASGPSDSVRPSAVTPAAPVRSSTFGLLYGLAGGFMALLIAGGLQYAGILGEPSSGNDDGQTQAELASLKSQLTELTAVRSSDVGRSVEILPGEIAQLRSEIEKSKSAGSSAEAKALIDLDQRIKDIETTVTELGQGTTASNIDALNEKVSALEATLQAVNKAYVSDDGKIAALEYSVLQLTAKIDAQASQSKIAQVIATLALKSAVDRGGAFNAELETFAAISPGAPELVTLRRLAAQGVATHADIIAAIDSTANAMIAADKPVNSDAGIVEWLLSSVKSLIKVRPVGEVEGHGVPETVARMEFSVSQGDLAKALAEYETLPKVAQVAGADYAVKLKARHEVETLVDQLVASAMQK